MPKSRPHRTKAARLRTHRQAPAARDLPRDVVSFPVVGIGASAGGLEACRKLIDAMPAVTGMAFILVQHLDPSHESMMVDLLAGHTAMTVRQAADGMLIEPDHLYVIPPGTYLSVGSGALHLSLPQARHGARLPFDFLLNSLAVEFGRRAVGVILSGTGADGSLGVKAIKAQGGLIVAQDPDEADYDGMPRSAIATGGVDFVLPVAKIPEALVEHGQGTGIDGIESVSAVEDRGADRLHDIIDLLRTKTTHDFTLYKPGTVRRRLLRRMALAAIDPSDMDRYFEILRSDVAELDLLATDLLINVTRFFRDPKVFDFLARKIVPDMVRDHSGNRPIRIWIAGCSTGEETYSLAMLFHEQIAATDRDIKLQFFASDVDPVAIAVAREGFYPQTIDADLSPERLARFFSKEEHGYRILPELRAAVVFTVQDVLADPPFSRLDLISCRNLLIYLRPEAQAKVVSLFHFALAQGGVLLLGSAETIADIAGRFEVISKPERLYRNIGRNRPERLGFPLPAGDGARVPARFRISAAPATRESVFAELCRRLVAEAYGPATILINHEQECLYFLGPVDRYLRIAPGQPTNDVLAVARPELRIRLRSAIRQAIQENARIVAPGGQVNQNGKAVLSSIVVQPIPDEGEKLLLICFIDEAVREPGLAQAPDEIPRVTVLERELQAAILDLEIANEEQRAVNEEALSVSEEYQSTNEELVTSKEELQSMNEELTALNTQLQETLETQRTTANDLQNVLYSTDVATLFLDKDLHIRFFTPAATQLFGVILGDIGRPLVDLSSLAADLSLPADARRVLNNLEPIEREIEGRGGNWYIRRILPYRAQGNGVEGVVITFADITERRHTGDALEAAKRQAEQANRAKSRFLAAASHDLRQPLQTLAMLQGLFASKLKGKVAPELIVLLEHTLDAMAGMLNTLLDVNQIDAGIVRPEMTDFPVNALLSRLRDEFAYHTQAKGLDLRVVACGLTIHSDPRLLEQMIRNLLSNAVKYTEKGKVLIGCRRRDGMLAIEIWDTGIGIPGGELQTIFEEYHQVDNAARERSRGLGLGLAIVRRLGNLLNHRVRVRSQPGKGSMFAIEVGRPAAVAAPRLENHRHYANERIGDGVGPGTILVVEDDPDMRNLIQLFLKNDGHEVSTAPDGPTALELVAQGLHRPDLVLADYKLPNGLNGLQFVAKLREAFRHEVPVIILTGDISTETLRDIAHHNCVQLHKPVSTKKLTHAIQRVLAQSHLTVASSLLHAAEAVVGPEGPVIFIVDDDRHIREGLRGVLEEDGRTVEDFASGEAFLDAYRPGREACLLIDAYLPGMSGLEVLQRLNDTGQQLPSIMITGNSDVPMAVEAMKAGALDFIEKPIRRNNLLAHIERAFDLSRDSSKLLARRETAANHLAGLTARQHQIMDLVLAGYPSKNIAADLGISQRTVENHRASIMKKTGAKSLPALARIAFSAT